MPESRLQRTRDAYRCSVCGGHLLEGDHSGCSRIERMVRDAAKLPRLSDERVGEILRNMAGREEFFDTASDRPWPKEGDPAWLDGKRAREIEAEIVARRDEQARNRLRDEVLASIRADEERDDLAWGKP